MAKRQTTEKEEEFYKNLGKKMNNGTEKEKDENIEKLVKEYRLVKIFAWLSLALVAIIFIFCAIPK